MKRPRHGRPLATATASSSAIQVFEQRQLEWRAPTTTLAGDESHVLDGDNYATGEDQVTVNDNYVCRLEHTRSGM